MKWIIIFKELYNDYKNDNDDSDFGTLQKYKKLIDQWLYNILQI